MLLFWNLNPNKRNYCKLIGSDFRLLLVLQPSLVPNFFFKLSTFLSHWNFLIHKLLTFPSYRSNFNQSFNFGGELETGQLHGEVKLWNASRSCLFQPTCNLTRWRISIDVTAGHGLRAISYSHARLIDRPACNWCKCCSVIDAYYAVVLCFSFLVVIRHCWVRLILIDLKATATDHLSESDRDNLALYSARISISNHPTLTNHGICLHCFSCSSDNLSCLLVAQKKAKDLSFSFLFHSQSLAAN